MVDLYSVIKDYTRTNAYPFHMPGHKRHMDSFMNPFQIDITEIHNFDNLHHAEGILKESQERAASLYGSEETHYLVNGSTCGILSAVSACVRRRGKILMGRNCHKAAYHGVFLNEVESFYLYPQLDEVYDINCGQNTFEIENMLKHNPGIEAVLITSPTYDGVVSDVKRIAEIAHSFRIPLIVDEAHGSHFGFSANLPESSVALGADIVIHSLHKTLPSLTQTALLHVNGTLVDRERLRKYLEVYQTSSPSYVLMASMDRCVAILEREGEQLFEGFCHRLNRFYKRMRELKRIRIPDVGGESWEAHKIKQGIFDFDASKLILSVKDTGLSGQSLSNILRKQYNLEMEMEAESYALALTSIFDSENGFERLGNALLEIDHTLYAANRKGQTGALKGEVREIKKNRVAMSIYEAEEYEKNKIGIWESAGKISGEYIYLYPPGIPLLVPGEYIDQDLLVKLKDYQAEGLNIQGLRDYQGKNILVLQNPGG